LTLQPSRDLLQTLFENAPRFVERLTLESADSYDTLIDRAQELAAQLSEAEQVELIDGHPRIGAVPTNVSASSYQEQGYDQDPGTAELQRRLDALNDEYERRFGFRFVIFVAGRPRSEIADIMESRMSASREDELERALSDVFAIARDRLKKRQGVLEEAT
jgi:2-oxo-4-hydroxy-4-carboxy--5-ureidoimidazoline (OHCU) decarboxylase